MGNRFVVSTVLVGVVVALGFSQQAFANRFASPSYTIDASSTGDSLAGPNTSTSYRLVSTGGESIVGNASSGSYKLGQGYTAQLEQSIELNLSPTTIGLGSFTPGTSTSASVTASVISDAPGYNLSASQDHDLQSGSYTIAPVSGTIGSPVTWSEGSTKGLGFTLVSTNATPIPGSWNSGSAYAGFPETETTFYTRSGYSGGTTDTLTMRVKLDVNTSQQAASYSNTVTWVGTSTP